MKKITLGLFLLVATITSSLSGQISNDNLLAYYPFNGDVLDFGPNGYDGDLVGGSFVEDRNGNPNSALKLNGVSDYVNLTAFAEVLKNNLNEISFYFLLKVESNQPNQVILSLGNDGETIANNVFEIELENNQFQIETETGDDVINHELKIDQIENIIDQQWHQIQIKIKGDSVTYCRDNELIFKGEYIPAETTTNELFIGAFDGNSPTEDCCYLDGIIDELQIYSSLEVIAKDTLSFSSCVGEEFEIEINNTIYNIDNPSGSELIASDCCIDTLVTIDLIYFEDINIEVNEEHCTTSNFQLEINNTTYDIDNPTGVETITTISGCDSIFTINLTFEEALCDIRLPNIFTPGGSENSIFRIGAGSNVEILDLQIYDRWGNLVYDNENPEREWDGNINGTPAPSEVYIYTVIYQFAGQEPIQESSDLTLLR